MLSSSGRRSSWRVESNRLPWLGGLRTSTWKGEINQKNTPALSPLAFFFCQGETDRNLGNLFCFRLGAPFPFPRVGWKRGDVSSSLWAVPSSVIADCIEERSGQWRHAPAWTSFRWLKRVWFLGQTKMLFFGLKKEWKRKRRFNGRNVWLVERGREKGEKRGSRGEGNCISFGELERRRLFDERGWFEHHVVFPNLISLGG